MIIREGYYLLGLSEGRSGHSPLGESGEKVKVTLKRLEKEIFLGGTEMLFEVRTPTRIYYQRDLERGVEVFETVIRTKNDIHQKEAV